MNLHSIVGPIVAAINPTQTVQVRVSTGFTTSADGRRVPTYAPAYSAPAQVQAMSSRDLRQLDGLNLQGSMSAIYFYGDIEGIVRPALKGGDLIDFPNGQTFLVVVALENWGDPLVPSEQWSKVAAQLQNES